MIRALPLILITLILSSCSILPEREVITSVYVIDSPEKIIINQPSRNLKVNVSLPHFNAGLGSEKVILRQNNRLDFYEGARWASATPEMIRAVIVESIEKSGKFAAVNTETSSATADYTLSCDIRDFNSVYLEMGTAPDIITTLSCNLYKTGNESFMENIQVSSKVKASEDKMDSIIVSFQQSSDKIMLDLLDKMIKSMSLNTNI